MMRRVLVTGVVVLALVTGMAAAYGQASPAAWGKFLANAAAGP